MRPIDVTVTDLKEQGRIFEWDGIWVGTSRIIEGISAWLTPLDSIWMAAALADKFPF